MPSIFILYTASLLLLQGTQPGSPATSTKPFAEHPPIYCTSATAQNLPGDYYFCEGNRSLQKGKTEAALAHFETAASWGDKRAMFNMGLVYIRGMGVASNKPLGLAWLALAAERPESQLEREVLAGAMKAADPQTRAQADIYWNQLKLKYADRVALSRAQARYEQSTRTLRQAVGRDPAMSVWVSGLAATSGVAQETMTTGFMGNTGPVLGASNTGTKTLNTLDQAAEEVILRTPKGKKGRVITGPLMRTPPTPKRKPASNED